MAARRTQARRSAPGQSFTPQLSGDYVGRRVEIRNVAWKSQSAYFKPGQFGYVIGQTQKGGMWLTDTDGNSAPGEVALLVAKTREGRGGAFWFSTAGVRFTGRGGEHRAPVREHRMREPNGRMDSFTSAYFETALWSSTDESDESGGEPLDKNYDVSDIAPETRNQMIADCADFQERFYELLTAAPIDYSRAGHNFWLSRNGHGAGFFDDDLDELQAAAESYGSFDLYIGDDGAIHGSPLAPLYNRRDPRQVNETKRRVQTPRRRR